MSLNLNSLTVTNAINGSITGNAATVTTNANLTGPVTSVGNATTITNDAVTTAKILNNNVTYAKLQQVAGLSVVGNSTNSTATAANITGSANQVLRVSNDGTALAFGQVNLSDAQAVTGTLPVSRGGTGGTTQATARTTGIGATTVGSNLITLADPGATRFIRINSDNTISALNDTDFRNAIGAGTGGVTVTSGDTTANWFPVVWHSGNALYSSTGVQIYANGGYVQANYFNSSDDVNTGNITNIVAKFGDNYHRSATAAKVAAFITGQSMNISGTATNVTGTVAVGNGGTGATSFTAGYVLFGNGTSAISTNVNLFWDNTNSRLGIGTSPASPYRLDVNGTIHYTTITASSDVRFKKNVQVISNPLGKLSSVRGVRFEWNEFINARRDGYELNKPTFGVIAQELEEVFPELVSHWKLSDDCPDARSVNYEKIIPVLIEAVKELDNKNKLLEARILALENK